MNNLLNNIKKLSKDIKIEIIYSKNKNYKCVKTFKTLHNDPINNLIVYQNYIISSSDDKTIKLWNVDGKYLGKISRKYDQYLFSPWGALSLATYKNLIISGWCDGEIQIHDIDQIIYGTPGLCEVQRASDGNRNFKVVALLVNKDKLYSASLDDKIRIWEIDDTETKLKIYKIIECPIDRCTNLVLQGKNIIQNGMGYINIWDEEGKLIKKYKDIINTKEITNIIVDGEKVIFGLNRDSIQIFDLEKGICIKKFGFNHYSSLAKYKNKIISHKNNSLLIWNQYTGKCVKLIDRHSDIIIKIKTYGNKIISCSYDNTIKIWEEEKEIDTYKRFLKTNNLKYNLQSLSRDIKMKIIHYIFSKSLFLNRLTRLDNIDNENELDTWKRFLKM
jgi:WD40 repeat protein